MLKPVFIASLVFLISACQSNQLVYPSKQTLDPLAWTAEDKQKPIAIRHLDRSEYSSTHLIRLQTQEQPHYHDHHDLNVTVLSGNSTIHFADHSVALKTGDVVFIPKGTLHWAENHVAEGSVVFAVFSPAYSGKDQRMAD